jgi:hypothetical protein
VNYGSSNSMAALCTNCLAGTLEESGGVYVCSNCGFQANVRDSVLYLTRVTLSVPFPWDGIPGTT